MTDIAKLKELRERVIAATGPDRELDVTILATLLCAKAFVVVKSRFNGAWVAMTEERRGAVCWETPSPFNRKSDLTASTDAVRALVRHTFPNACISTNEWAKDGAAPAHADCGISINGHELDLITGDGEAATLPLATCAALLSALIAQAERAGE